MKLLFMGSKKMNIALISIMVYVYQRRCKMTTRTYIPQFESVIPDINIYIILALLLLIKIAPKVGGYIFDETRSVHNRPHKHLYTKIRDEWYDFAIFDHPGGPIALNLVQNRDATALFESHHLLSSRIKMEKVLLKYKVDRKVASHLQVLDKMDDGAHYEWSKYESDPFVTDMKEVLLNYFQPIASQRGCSLYQATKASSRRLLLIGALFVAFFSTLPSFVNGEYWTLFVTPQLAWLFIANYWHDCLHFSLTSDWRVNAWLPYLLPLLSSPWLWYHQHVLGHHAYTNISYKDPDLAHAPQLLREHKSVSWKPLHQSQGTFYRITLVWSIAVCVGLNLLNDIRANLKLSYNNVVPYARLSKPRNIAHISGRICYLYITFIWPFLYFGWSKALIWVIIPNIGFSMSFMINSQINHLTIECSDACHTNFLKHQVLTAQNFGMSSWFCGIYSGHLNYQIEHHLFPFVNHCHLPYLAPMVEKVCDKHNVSYRKAKGYFDAFQMHFDHTKEMSKDDVVRF